MCGYRGKRRARSLTGGIDSLLDVRGESVVSLPSLSSGDLQGDGLEGASSPEVWLHTAAVMCASRFVAAGLPSPFTCVVTAVVRHAMTYSPPCASLGFARRFINDLCLSVDEVALESEFTYLSYMYVRVSLYFCRRQLI